MEHTNEQHPENTSGGPLKRMSRFIVAMIFPLIGIFVVLGLTVGMSDGVTTKQLIVGFIVIAAIFFACGLILDRYAASVFEKASSLVPVKLKTIVVNIFLISVSLWLIFTIALNLMNKMQ